MKTVTVGSIIRQTIDVIANNISSIALYIAVLGLGSSLAVYVTDSDAPANTIVGGLVQIVVSLAGIVAGYLLMEAMLKRAGLFHYGGGRRYFAYLGQGILMLIGVALGFALLIIPGIILALRWVIAAPLLIGTGAGAVEGLERSWRMTKGHAGTIFLAMLPMGLLLLVFIGVTATLAVAGPRPEDGAAGLVSLVLQNLATYLISVVVTAVSVALFGLLDTHAAEISEVFA